MEDTPVLLATQPQARMRPDPPAGVGSPGAWLVTNWQPGVQAYMYPAHLYHGNKHRQAQAWVLCVMTRQIAVGLQLYPGQQV